MPHIQVHFSEESLPERRKGMPPSHSLYNIAGDLFFATPEMVAHPLLSDVKAFALYFGTEQDHVYPLPQFAPLFAHVLDGLTGDRLVAVISTDTGTCLPMQMSAPSRVTYRQGTLAGWVVNYELAPKRLWHFSLIDPARVPFQPGHAHFFFECPRSLVQHYFEEYLGTIGTNDIEGYILDRAAIPRLVEWNLGERSVEVFNEIMNTAFAAFHTFFDNKGILVFTRQLDLEGFQQRIQLDRLQQLVLSMSADEQEPYWQMLGELDRFAYNQRVEQIGELRDTLQVSLRVIEQDDPAWSRRFQEGWEELEQAYRPPLYPSTSPQGASYSVGHMDLARIFTTLNALREMVRSQLRLYETLIGEKGATRPIG